MRDTTGGVGRDLVPLTVGAAKDAAHKLRARTIASGEQMTLSAAYERIARSEGFKDWNAYLAHLKAAEPQTSDDLVAFNVTVLLGQGAVSLRDPALAHFSRFDAGGTDLYSEPLVELIGLPESSLDEAIPAITQLFDVAHAVARIDETVFADDVYALLNGLCGHHGNRPYCLEQNRGRWPNGAFYLVRRSYKELGGLHFTEAELKALGVWDWAMESEDSTFGMVPLFDNDLLVLPDPKRLRQLARVLIRLACHAIVRSIGQPSS